jgi:hypothetical protein
MMLHITSLEAQYRIYHHLDMTSVRPKKDAGIEHCVSSHVWFMQGLAGRQQGTMRELL